MKTESRFTSRVSRLALVASMILGLGMVSSTALADEEATTDETGTDPRAFTSKFMPYYIYTELENDVQIQQINMFGLYAFDEDFALTYDMPVAKEIDFDDSDIPADTENGVGDLGLRFFYKPEATQFVESSHMVGAELTLPTANEDILGGNATVASPMYVYVRNVTITAPGFIAMMNFMDYDIMRDEDVDKIRRYRGRWFAMIPLAKPGPDFLDGWYMLPELQQVYDFEADDDEFSLWFAPELGKIVAKNFVMYAKPGMGIVKDADTDRDVTFEFGFRYFMDD